MKKALLAGTALIAATVMATPAHAELDLNLSGYFLGYGVVSDSDPVAGAANSLREFDLRRESEIYVSGETTLDNGLTVGFMTQLGLSDNVSRTSTDEVYAYLSGGWGRFQLGSEDGAAYLLQVGAPGADSNVDGMLNWIQVINRRSTFDTVATSPYLSTGVGGASAVTDVLVGLNAGSKLDYNHQSVGTGDHAADRFTYLTPKFSGFQAGVSYTPEPLQNVFGGGAAAAATDSDLGDYDETWEISARWDGEYEGFGISVGAGYSDSDLEDVETTANILALAEDFASVQTDGLTTFNTGLNVTFSGFSLGGVWMRAETESSDAIDVANTGANTDVIATDVEQDTIVIGAAWDNGPYHVGASWFSQETERGINGDIAADDGLAPEINYEVERYTVGGGYTFGPGMSFRGSVMWGEIETNSGTAADDNDFSQVSVGTVISF